MTKADTELKIVFGPQCETYDVRLCCLNCGEIIPASIEKGITIQDCCNRTPCTYCGCYDLDKE